MEWEATILVISNFFQVHTIFIYRCLITFILSIKVKVYKTSMIRNLINNNNLFLMNNFSYFHISISFNNNRILFTLSKYKFRFSSLKTYKIRNKFSKCVF